MGLPLSSDHPESQKLINYGVTTFDNLLFGFITIFQMITQEGWVYLMNLLVDSGHPWIARIFCVGIIISCSFFIMNVFLAVLAESIEEASKEDPYEIKRKDDISKSLLRARTQKQSFLGSDSKKKIDRKILFVLPVPPTTEEIKEETDSSRSENFHS